MTDYTHFSVDGQDVFTETLYPDQPVNLGAYCWTCGEVWCRINYGASSWRFTGLYCCKCRPRFGGSLRDIYSNKVMATLPKPLLMREFFLEANRHAE
jgi:hypothetical protein